MARKKRRPREGPRAEVLELLDKMEKEWPACNYHIVQNNCVHFSQFLSANLKVRPEGASVPIRAGRCLRRFRSV